MKPLIIILLTFIPFKVFSQISGIVIDRNSGYPVRNVTIRVENQNTGTKSDYEGKFRFKEDFTGKILIISAIGFESQRVVVDKEVLEIYLTTKVYLINEVLVVSKNNKRDFYFKRKLVSSIRCEPCFEIISPGQMTGYRNNKNGEASKKSGVRNLKSKKPMDLIIEFTLSD
jgi:hypothetical protein